MYHCLVPCSHSFPSSHALLLSVDFLSSSIKFSVSFLPGYSGYSTTLCPLLSFDPLLPCRDPYAILGMHKHVNTHIILNLCSVYERNHGICLPASGLLLSIIPIFFYSHEISSFHFLYGCSEFHCINSAYVPDLFIC